MKARIEKKLSKRLVALYPALYHEAWLDEEPTELAYQQGTCVRLVPSVGGGTDYWGEGEDAYTVWQHWLLNWPWYGPFDFYPEGHEHGFYPNTEGFKPTTQNLLRLAAECEARDKGGRP